MQRDKFFESWSERHGNAKVTGIVKTWLSISYFVAKILCKFKLSANTITILGLIFAILLYMNAKLIWAPLFLVLSLLSDGIDGSLAIISGKSSKWGALLDSTLDRFSDAAIFIGALLFYIESSDPLVVVLLVAVSASFMVSYIKARAESLSIACNGGVAERSERLIIVLVAYGLHGLGVDYIMAIGLWTVALLSLFTVYQRMMIVYKAVN